MKSPNDPLHPGNLVVGYLKENFILCVGCNTEKNYARIYSKQKKKFVGNFHGQSSYLQLRVRSARLGVVKNLKLHHVVYLLFHGHWPREQLDHIKSDGWNNHPLNLEPVTDAENQRRKNERLKGARRNYYESKRAMADYDFPPERGLSLADVPY